MTKIKLINQLPKEEDILKRKNFKKVIDNHMSQQSAVKWTERWSIWKSAGLGAAIIGGAFAFWSIDKSAPKMSKIDAKPKKIKLTTGLPEPIQYVAENQQQEVKIDAPIEIKPASNAVTTSEVEQRIVKEKHPTTQTNQASLNLSYPIENGQEQVKVLINGWPQKTFTTKEVNQIRDIQIIDTKNFSDKKVIGFDAMIGGKRYHIDGSFFDGSARRAILQLKSGDKIIIENIKLSDNTMISSGDEFLVNDKIF